MNPHDILAIKGPRAVQEYLLNEIQEVYRLQGVKINDKHIGVIVRQMLQKVRITDSGDTQLLEGENVDRTEFREVNQKAIAEGLKPARSELKGLKENIIIGHLIPAGTGIHRYSNVEFMVEQSYSDEEIIPLTEPGELVPGLGIDTDVLALE